MNCTSCGTALAPTAKFCHKCGTKVGDAPAAGGRQSGGASWQIGLPWGIAGAALGALITVLAMRGGSGGGGGSAGAPFAGGGPGGGAMATTDISQMSPEEAATRLYNRVMILASQQKQDSVRFFLPMAIGAYNQLPALDADARYHLGVLYLAGGQPDQALAQADSIRKATPTHLFAIMLRARAYQAKNDAAASRRAFADFLKNEGPERQRQRPEYGDHRSELDSFHQEATAAGSR